MTAGRERTTSEYGEAIWNALPPPARRLFSRLRELAPPQARAALVGGAVRDALLGRLDASPDLDFVLWGADVQRLASDLHLPLVWHPVYNNATLTLPDGSHADLVSARRERYPLAGGPPHPLPGTLEDDLERRDYSLNALALELLPDGTRALLGVPSALDDLHAGVLRPLHPRSLHDDASRLVRAARLAARLGLEAHPDLLAQVPLALEVAAQTPRLDAELRLLLHEPSPGGAARRLEDWGAASLLPPGSATLLERLKAGAPPDPPLAAALLLAVSDDPARLATRLHLGERPAALLERARSPLPFPAGSREARLRELLGLALPYPPLQGRDLLALGLSAGPELGRVLAWLAQGRQEGRFTSAQDEREAVLARLKAG
ncbi:CCA tRNA nucleotidyltransferase [Deinococcus sp.]|uniref:CCA tRNA nucleotidyltransferase n=1 Tax=Deinococcus sp. TaxID=47478 RepID=UPI003CC66AE7